MPIVKLDSHFIKHHLQSPTGQRKTEYCSADIPGFMVTVTEVSPGKGSYQLRYKALGQTKYIKIGRTYDISLADAKKKALALKSEIASGRDPRAEEKALKAVPTLTEYAKLYYFPQIRNHIRTAEKYVQYWRLRIGASSFANKRMNKIRRHEIQLFHASLLEEGLRPATANRYLSLIKAMLNAAIRDEVFAGPNPAKGIRLFHEDNEVNHYLTSTELDRLITVLQSDKNRRVCLIILFLLATGARLGETLRTTWSEIDRVNRVWRIPASNSKSKRVRSVPLNDAAIDVLNQLDTECTHENLFVNPRSGDRYCAINRVWGRLRNKAEIPFFRIHDCRHQFASWLANDGRSLQEIGQLLGHSSSNPSITRRYSHLAPATLQDASACASDMIKGAMKSA